MDKINYQKIALLTLLKVIAVAIIFFSLNNWEQIKTSFSGAIPPFSTWIDHAFKPSNVILIVLLGFIFFKNDLKKHRELLDKRKKTI